MRIQSDYALNKREKEAIVYKDVYGNLVRLTVDQFGSEEEFLKWKAWSDGNYHSEDKADQIESHKVLPYESVEEEKLSCDSCEDEYIDQQEREGEYRKCVSILSEALGSMTDTQRRRILMRYRDGISTAEIAQKEGVSRQMIYLSLSEARRIANTCQGKMNCE